VTHSRALFRIVPAAFALAGSLVAGPAAATQTGPVRVATLLPYVADALATLPPEDVVVVASVRGDMRTPPAPPTIDLGSPHSPSYEKLAEANADVIIGEQAMHGAMTEKLSPHGELLLVDSGSVESTLAGLQKIGKRVGAEQEMDAEVARTQAGLAEQTLATPVPTLLLFGTPGAILVVSDRTWIGDLAKQVKLENVGDELGGKESFPGYVQASDEVLAGLRPELILLVAHGDPTAIKAAFEAKMTGGPLAPLKGSASKGVHVLPSASFASNPGLGLATAAEQLHSLAAGSGAQAH
jgi:iron complex transport system substrate-binding protein